MVLRLLLLSDSNGYIYDPDGIDLDVVKQIKEVERKRIKEYVNRTSHSRMLHIQRDAQGIWSNQV